MIRKILSIALPSMGSSLLYTTYSLVDMMWIGRMGKDAIASVTLSLSVLNMTYVLNEIFGVASMVLLTRRWGEGRKDEYERIVNQVLIYKFIAGLIVMVSTFSFIKPLLTWMGRDVPLKDALYYYYIRGSFLPLSFMLGTMMTSYRSIGDTKTLFYVQAVGSALNIALDPVLMFTAGMGVSGSALASGISEVLTLALGFYNLRKKWGVRTFKFKSLDLDVLKKVFKIGTPSFFDSLNWTVSNFVVVKMFASLGLTATAVYGITSRVVEIVWMIGFALEGAITTLVGQSLGARSKEKALKVYRDGLKIALLIGVSIGIFISIFSESASEFFSKDPELIEVESDFLRIISPSFVFMILINVVYGALIGGGRTIDTFVLGVITIWFIRIPVFFLAFRIFGTIESMGLSWTLGMAISALIGVVHVSRSKRWLENEL